MDKIEILKYLQVGGDRSVCVDRCLLQDYPGFVRDVKIKAPADVLVEINTFGYDEGGLLVRLRYENISAALAAVERYVGRPLTDWENFTKTGSYPSAPADFDLSSSGQTLKEDLRRRRLDLPKEWLDCEIPQGYWRDVAEGRVE